MEPLTFAPIYMTRVWGGREFERVYHRQLPDPTLPYGESWEIVDRVEQQSVVDHGPLTGVTLHELWSQRGEEIFGDGFSNCGRFPILIKLLDARDDLSIQVHPPAALATSLGGEAKTEMWFIADCEAGAELYTGLKRGVTRADFENAIVSGRVEECVHVIHPQPGDAIFIPSGRIHAIGGGFLIHEIQQNSDTTYRVFDWNRAGLDGKPRELHVEESLASIDFGDVEPSIDTPVGGCLASCPHFRTDRRTLVAGEILTHPVAGQFVIISVVDGVLESAGGRRFEKGRFLLLPRDAAPLTALENATVLLVTLPQ